VSKECTSILELVENSPRLPTTNIANTASTIDSVSFTDKVIIIPDMYVIQSKTNNVTQLASTVVLIFAVTLGT
jgi:hypothetical protein